MKKKKKIKRFIMHIYQAQTYHYQFITQPYFLYKLMKNLQRSFSNIWLSALLVKQLSKFEALITVYYRTWN